MSDSQIMAAVLGEMLQPTSYSVRWDGGICQIQQHGRPVHREMSMTMALHWLQRHMPPDEVVQAAGLKSSPT